jgi:hypothetical protein
VVSPVEISVPMAKKVAKDLVSSQHHVKKE